MIITVSPDIVEALSFASIAIDGRPPELWYCNAKNEDSFEFGGGLLEKLAKNSYFTFDTSRLLEIARQNYFVYNPDMGNSAGAVYNAFDSRRIIAISEKEDYHILIHEMFHIASDLLEDSAIKTEQEHILKIEEPRRERAINFAANTLLRLEPNIVNDIRQESLERYKMVQQKRKFLLGFGPEEFKRRLRSDNWDDFRLLESNGLELRMFRDYLFLDDLAQAQSELTSSLIRYSSMERISVLNSTIFRRWKRSGFYDFEDHENMISFRSYNPEGTLDILLHPEFAEVRVKSNNPENSLHILENLGDTLDIKFEDKNPTAGEVMGDGDSG